MLSHILKKEKNEWRKEVMLSTRNDSVEQI